jgi:hypothetical protein
MYVWLYYEYGKDKWGIEMSTEEHAVNAAGTWANEDDLIFFFAPLGSLED